MEAITSKIWLNLCMTMRVAGEYFIRTHYEIYCTTFIYYSQCTPTTDTSHTHTNTYSPRCLLHSKKYRAIRLINCSVLPILLLVYILHCILCSLFQFINSRDNVHVVNVVWIKISRNLGIWFHVQFIYVTQLLGSMIKWRGKFRGKIETSSLENFYV